MRSICLLLKKNFPIIHKFSDLPHPLVRTFDRLVLITSKVTLVSGDNDPVRGPAHRNGGGDQHKTECGEGNVLYKELYGMKRVMK